MKQTNIAHWDTSSKADNRKYTKAHEAVNDHIKMQKGLKRFVTDENESRSSKLNHTYDSRELKELVAGVLE